MAHLDYYTEAIHGKHEYLDLGHFEFEMGASLPNAKLAYKTHGKLNAAKDNAILFPHMYSGTPHAMERFIGKGRPLDPNKYFIILPGQFGNGFSSSPSNTPPPSDRGAFPQVTIGDDVRAQHMLVTEKFGIVYGATAYTLSYDGVTAKKSWFFFDNEIVCLGAGINSDAPETITTTINQSWARGDVFISDHGRVSPVGKTSGRTQPQWIWHDSIGYVFPVVQQVALSDTIQSGNWSQINYSRKGAVNGRVFKLWISHGKMPRNAAYAYIVVPGISRKGLQTYKKETIHILSNTKELQAVTQKERGILQAVFYTAGRLKNGQTTLVVDQPCIVQVSDTRSGGVKLSIADPTQQLKTIKLSCATSTMKQRELQIALPQGPYAGQSVSIDLKN